MDTDGYNRDRFSTARIETDPFPHFVLPDVLPPEIYKKMEAALPPLWRWKLSSRIENRKRGPGVQPIFGVREPDTYANFALSPYRQKWKRSFGPTIELIYRLTIASFKPHVDAYRKRIGAFGAKIEGEVGLGQASFCRRETDWGTDRHTHGLNQIIQSMIYFPTPGSSVEQGTVLYRVTKPLKISARDFVATRHFDHSEVEAAAVLPYKLNHLVSFINTPEAVHSTPRTKGPARRYIFTCMQAIFDPGDAMITVGPRTRVLA